MFFKSEKNVKYAFLNTEGNPNSPAKKQDARRCTLEHPTKFLGQWPQPPWRGLALTDTGARRTS